MREILYGSGKKRSTKKRATKKQPAKKRTVKKGGKPSLSNILDIGEALMGLGSKIKSQTKKGKKMTKKQAKGIFGTIGNIVDSLGLGSQKKATKKKATKKKATKKKATKKKATKRGGDEDPNILGGKRKTKKRATRKTTRKTKAKAKGIFGTIGNIVDSLGLGSQKKATKKKTTKKKATKKKATKKKGGYLDPNILGGQNSNELGGKRKTKKRATRKPKAKKGKGIVYGNYSKVYAKGPKIAGAEKKKEKKIDPEFDIIKKRRNQLKKEYNERVKNILDRVKVLTLQRHPYDDEASKDARKEEQKAFRESLNRQLDMRLMENEINIYNALLDDYAKNAVSF